MTYARWPDRRAAGRLLAEELDDLRSAEPIVVGLPRGGVEVADEVAVALGAPLEIAVVRKVGAPGQPELGIGAVGSGGVTYINRPQGATTGAWPGYQPFGGWKASGSTGKSIGSYWYLPLYLREQSQTIVD